MLSHTAQFNSVRQTCKSQFEVGLVHDYAVQFNRGFSFVEICIRDKSGTNLFRHYLIIFRRASSRTESLTPFSTPAGACGKLCTLSTT